MFNQTEYNHSLKGHMVDKKYGHSEKNKIAQRKYSNSEKGKIAYTKRRQKYLKSEKGKQYMIRKQNRRVRNLGFNKLIENKWDCKVDWHHVNDNDVVPIPRNLHKLCYTGDSKKHREMCNRLINILYEGELKV